MKYECGAFVEWNKEGKTDILREHLGPCVTPSLKNPTLTGFVQNPRLHHVKQVTNALTQETSAAEFHEYKIQS
jgi:hypothetical protein